MVDAYKQVPCIRFDNRGRIRPDAWIVGFASPGKPIPLCYQNEYYLEWWLRILWALDIPPDTEYGPPPTYSLTIASLEW